MKKKTADVSPYIYTRGKLSQTIDVIETKPLLPPLTIAKLSQNYRNYRWFSRVDSALEGGSGAIGMLSNLVGAMGDDGIPVINQRLWAIGTIGTIVPRYIYARDWLAL